MAHELVQLINEKILVDRLALSRSAGVFTGVLVLGGEGMKQKVKEFYLSGGLDRYLRTTEGVDIVTLEAFVAKANQGNL